ncbi:DNA topoisomerase III [Chitinophaga caeni]|uniref:DNA topoisomerase n=1 Tax=Chitinophaga caeni TaxID=2029983 RepID=A0A291QYF7_9BACT|nr:type IA DNA topoisomerase [Chitinophaga caeni]ATL48970.1 DNA topoisomerase III [Chitinophaga caeni]
MKAVIAEKPSVAREIATLLGATEKKEGYLAGNGYLVTWALGHLAGPAMPEAYGLNGFQRAALPILPRPFLLTVRQVKKEKGHQADPGALKQLKIIGQVLQRCNSIIVATDAGREGELIFRYVYEYLECSLPFERLWISSLTEKAIRQGFERLRPGSDFEGLYQAARARSRADWLVGINATQALSIAAGSGIYSLGRVQTPTLALICKRYREHKDFVVRPYWQISLEHRKEFTDFKSLSITKWTERKSADEALSTIMRQGIAVVGAVERKTVTEQPPLLFDLTGLQKEANKKLNLSAEETLGIAQRLYEQQFITYPRTGSRYIPEDMWAEVPALIRALEDRPSCKDAVSRVKWGHFQKRIVNDLKVTDHHGLLITGKIPSALPARESAVYDMIALRLPEAVAQACTKELTHVSAEAAHHPFSLTGNKLLEPGWRAIKGIFSDEGEDAAQELPELKTGDELKIKAAKVLEKKTKAPALYSEATLLSAMETAGKDIETAEQRKALQGIGIGTPATRAAIIETLFKRDYICRDKKSLVPTEKGLQVYALIADRKIADVAMTAEWEVALQQIEYGQSDATAFHQDMENYVMAITRELLDSSLAGESQPELLCPKCKTLRLLIRDKVVKCPDEGCGWLQFRTVCGVQLAVPDIESLIRKGRSPLIKGMKSRSGKKFNAFIVLDDHGNTSFQFDNSTRHGKKK